ncbi:hypothetical protein C8R44DRAFT_766568 [Mycena epipterygia]|nr:hypothetical protein C8R44DRAFT_766568 [Mycena epipterygia]
MHKAILTVASNLVEARIHTEGPPPDFGEIIHLLRLQRLSVSHEDILGHLSAPVLQEIAFYVPEEEDPDYLLHLDPFLLRSGCSLRRLSFDGAPTTLAAVNILQKYPSITELAIIVHNMEGFYTRTNDLISQLAIPNPTGSAVVSPQLSEITFGCSDESYIDYALYLQMLRSRRNAKDCAITSAVLLTAPGTRLGVATLRGLDVLRRGGMDICVLQGTEAVSLLNSLTYAPSWIH